MNLSHAVDDQYEVSDSDDEEQSFDFEVIFIIH